MDFSRIQAWIQAEDEALLYEPDLEVPHPTSPPSVASTYQAVLLKIQEDVDFAQEVEDRALAMLLYGDIPCAQ